MRVTIHQPNFVPWYPFMKKMAEADVFVILGHCQFEKNGFQNRFRLNPQDKWHTLAVHRGLEPINQKRYVRPVQDWDRIRGELPAYKGLLSEFNDEMSTNLMDTNCAIIAGLAKRLKIRTPIEYDLDGDLKGTARLVAICQRFGATEYLAGASWGSYINPALFAAAGIRIVPFECTDKRHTLEVLS